jgi:hypothetical protein
MARAAGGYRRADGGAINPALIGGRELGYFRAFRLLLGSWLMEAKMKRLLVSLVASTMLLGAVGFTSAYRVADTPQCCQNHASCCPNSSCCSGGKHAQCSMHVHHA